MDANSFLSLIHLCVLGPNSLFLLLRDQRLSSYELGEKRARTLLMRVHCA